jgi:hypothetical protein
MGVLMNKIIENNWHLVIGFALGIVLVAIFASTIYVNGKTQREIMFAESYCSSKGYSFIHNLDYQKGFKQTYTVHCVKDNDIFEAKYE